ncbi:transposable element Tc1 transposase [Trichonephila clavipes]|nr:transposable element Tc1 transposase [Trichonephila clavipes]
MHCLPPNDVSVFAEEANQFALNERNNFRMAKKRKNRSVNIQLLNSVMKDTTPFHQRNKEKEKNLLRQKVCTRVKFEQISVFERGRIVGLREAGLSYRAVAARVQRNSSTIMRVSKQCVGQLGNPVGCAQGFLYTGFLSRKTIAACDYTGPMCIGAGVLLQLSIRFNLWHHDGRIRVRLYAGEQRIPECIIERHSGRTPGVMVWGAIAYHG